MQQIGLQELTELIDVAYARKPGDRVAADQQLQEFQKSDIAWALSKELIESTNDSWTFFGAYTFFCKVRLDFYTLTNQNAIDLWESLVNCAKIFHHRYQPTLNMICCSLGVLCVQSVIDDKYISRIYNSFYNEEYQDIFLKVIRDIPVELKSSKLAIPDETLKYKRIEIVNHGEEVFSYIRPLLTNPQNNDDMIKLILMTIKSWVDISSISALSISKSTFLPILFNNMNNPNYDDISFDILYSIVDTYYDIERDRSVVDILVPSILQLMNNFTALVHQDYNRGINIYKIMGSVGCYFLRDNNNMISQQFFDILQFLFTVFDSQEREYIEETLEFWTEFLSVIKGNNTLEDQNSFNHLPTFPAVLESITKGCISSFRLPSDYWDLSDDDKNSWIDFRDNMMDIYTDIGSIIGIEHLFTYTYQSLLTTKQAYENQTGSLTAVEACLYGIRCLSIYSEVAVLPEMRTFFMNIQSYAQDLSIQNTMLRIIQKSSYHFGGQQQYLAPCIQYIQQAFNNVNLHRFASDAFRILCESNSQYFLSNQTIMLDTIHFVNTISLTVRDDFRVNLYKGLSTLVTRGDENMCKTYLEEILLPVYNALKTVVENEQNDSNTVLACLYIFTVFCEPYPCNPPYLYILLQENWNIFMKTITLFNNNDIVVEEFTRFFKHLMRINTTLFVTMVPRLLTVLEPLFIQNPIGSYVYYFGAVYGAFYQYTEVINQLNTNISVVINKCMELMQDRDSCLQNPDLLDDFFHYCQRLMEIIPQTLLGSVGILRPILRTAIMCSTIESRNAYHTINGFLVVFFSYCSRSINNEAMRQSCETVLNEFSQQLIQIALEGIFTTVPLSIIDDPECNNIQVLWCFYHYASTYYAQAFPAVIQQFTPRLFNQLEINSIIQNLLNVSDLITSDYVKIMSRYMTLARQRQRLL
ncbi:hypothetical protein WA158_000124 [Blastocystis sp. Blastoise]